MIFTLAGRPCTQAFLFKAEGAYFQARSLKAGDEGVFAKRRDIKQKKPTATSAKQLAANSARIERVLIDLIQPAVGNFGAELAFELPCLM